MSTALAIRDESTALTATVIRPTLLRPIAPPSEIIAAQNEARAMVHEALKEGRDFGVIPGTDKATMLKPGAERVALGFGCYYGTPEIIEKEIDHDRAVQWSKSKWTTCEKPAHWQELKAQGVGRNRKFDGKWVWQERRELSGVSCGLYRYLVKVDVIERATGAVVGSGVGACSSMEAKYIESPRDVENTILKMAHKRAVVAACLLTFGLSDEFTQDVEDLPRASAEGEERDGENEGADRAAPAERSEKPVEQPLTLEAALALPLAGKEGAWGGHAGKPLGEIPANLVARVLKWAATKIDEDAAEGKTTSANVVRLHAACALIVEMRNQSAERPTDPEFAQLDERISELLQHEKIPDATRKDLAQRADAATTVGALRLIADQLTDLIESPV